MVAVSGGIDSVALVHLLTKLNYPVALAHCNFNLRGDESDQDETFVKELGNQYHLETFTTSFQTERYAIEKKVSTQIAARELRYHWFENLQKQHRFEYVLTAHHADDSIETFLINLVRGTGLEGLTGIPEQNGTIVRPLLPFSRNQIHAFALQHNISWREDESNASTKYVRNKIRHQIVPLLKELNPSFLTSFQDTTSYLKGSQQIVNEAVNSVKETFEVTKEGDLTIDISMLKQVSNVNVYLHQLLKEYGFTQWDDIIHLLDAQSGKYVLSNTHLLLKDRSHLILSERKASDQKEIYLIETTTKEMKTPIDLVFDGDTENSFKNTHTIRVDHTKLSFPLTLRKWEKGDSFFPTGMTGKKKLSKYFKDEKYTLLDKERTWLLCTSHNDIIWIVGKRQDRRFTPDAESHKVVTITYSS